MIGKEGMLFMLILVFVSLFSMFASASFNFTGITHNQSGTVLSANVSLEVYSVTNMMTPSIILSTLSNGTGHFNITVNDTYATNGYMFKPVLKNYSSDNYNVAWIGQVLPAFPYSEFSSLGVIQFYLFPAVTMNLSAVNSTGDIINFSYQLKDARLGFPIAASFIPANMVYNVTLSFPKSRNYSIMIYPGNSFPLGYELTSMTVNNTYQNSTQNPDHINLRFNTSNTIRRVSGNISISGATNFTNIKIIPYLLETGNLVALSHPLPYNMSLWRAESDTYNISDGKFNITVPGATMDFKMLLFATAVKDGVYYGAFRNLTSSNSNVELVNFTFNMTTLVGQVRNITLSGAQGGTVDIQTKEVAFNITSGGSSLSNGNVEMDLDYTSGFTDGYAFTYMESINGTVYLPLLNASVKTMNIYTSSAAPKEKTYTASELALGSVNIALTAFNPGDISGANVSSYLQVGFYKSDSSCSVPYPGASCSLLNATDFGNFNPLTLIMGGGKIDFEMKLSSSNLTVRYIDVDMIASGPPDALFDSSANSSSSGANMGSVWRFGSLGPEIYSLVLVGIPYATTVDELAPFSVVLNKLYDENWGSVWNTTSNPNGAGYNTVANAGYADYNRSWFNLSDGGMQCSLTDTLAPCYVNTTYNMMWLRIPHFSGIGPTANSVTAGNVSMNTTTLAVDCTYNCTIYFNVSNGNYTLSTNLTNITINNTQSGSLINTTLYWYNGTAFKFNGTNSTMQLNYNFTLSNGSASTIHQYQIYVNKTSVTTAFLNLTYNISGFGSLLQLNFNLTCVESWSCGEWGVCSAEVQTRTCTDATGCGATINRPAISQSCTASSSSSSGGGGSTGTAGGVSNSVAGQYEKKIWTSINKDEKAVISVKDDKLGITGIEF
ncbi:hypothetical protein HYX11_04240, partial [Candidatus Woesearchaeota archaeon]|nr:hypothetical protein [Candidatus Woesearchaeota archaeon]